MDNLSLHNKLLNDFFTIGGNHKTEELKEIENRLTSYCKTNQDTPQINDVFLLLKMYANERENNHFVSSRKIVTPVLNRLINATEWDFNDIRILAIVINHTETYKHAQELAKKALNSLDEYSQEERFINIKFAIHFNITIRLLRARYFDIEYIDSHDEDELDKIFDKHIKEALTICRQEGLFAQEAALLIKRGLFEKNYAFVDENLKVLKDSGEKEAHKMMQDMVSDYNAHVGNAISSEQFNVMVGNNIRKIRQFKELSVDDLADMVGITPTFLSQIERGERGVSSHKLYKISNILDVKWELFFQDKDINTVSEFEIEVERQKLCSVALLLSKGDLLVVNQVAKKLYNYKRKL